jgi:hypothetical protein
MKNRNSVQRKIRNPARVDGGSAEPTEKSSQRTIATSNTALPATRAEAKAVAKQMLAQAGGVKDPDLAARIIDQVSRIQAVWPFGDVGKAFQVATEMLLEIKPESLMEAMLATQMIGVHYAALSCLQRTAFQGKSLEDLDAAARVTTRLMRLYMEQLEAMAKLKGKTGQQKVTVEHVHVHEGGQAIVGAVWTEPQK